MAISKDRKQELVTEYSQWVGQSKAMIVAEYKGLTMKDVDNIRKKLRENGAEFHILKNTLASLALENAGIPSSLSLFEGSTAVCFAFDDVAATAKSMMELAKSLEALKIKGGYLEKTALDAVGVKALSELPPLPVVRAQLLGVLLAPASKLVRTLAEPARAMAAVIKAHAEPEPEPAPAPAG